MAAMFYEKQALHHRKACFFCQKFQKLLTRVSHLLRLSFRETHKELKSWERNLSTG